MTHLNIKIIVFLFLFLSICLQQDDTKSLTLVHTRTDLVSTVDGTLYSINIRTGELKWSLDTGGPLITSASLNAKNFVIPSINGNLYMVFADGERVQKLPITARELVDMSPFQSEDGLLYLSSKQTVVLVVDGWSGKLLCKYKSYSAGESDKEANEQCKNYEKISMRSNIVYMVRTDYAVHALDAKSGKMKWNLTFAEIFPSQKLEQVRSTAYGFEKTPRIAYSNADGSMYLLNTITGKPSVFKFPSQPVALFQTDAETGKFVQVNMPAITDNLSALRKLKSGPPEKAVYVTTNESGSLYVLEMPNLRKSLPRISDIRALPPSSSSSKMDKNCPLIGLHTLKPFDKKCAPKSEKKRVKFEPRKHEVDVPVDNINKPTNIWKNSTLILATLLIFSGGVITLLARNVKLSKKIAEEKPPEEHKKPKKKKKPQKFVKQVPKKDGFTNVGNLLISQKILGKGCNGTVVYEGELDGRQVAVKRMLREFYEIANKEISLLIQSDQHPNVVRYFAKEEDEQFIYLALELCPYTLAEIHENKVLKNFNLTEKQKRDILYQLSAAIAHLHNLNIVHRDLKPHNVLLSKDLRVKLSDMGLGKRLELNKSSFHTSVSGTIGWTAPELLREDKNVRMTNAVDIFSLGCIMYYVHTNGEHPFGQRYNRENNIVLGKHNLEKLNDIPELKHLIESMICVDPTKRITAQEVLRHPYFWDDERKLAFICDVSDQIGKERQNSSVFHKLEAKKKKFLRGNTQWNSVIDECVMNNVKKFRNYDFGCMWDLLRLIRNIRGHYREYDEQVQELMKPLPSGIYVYFEKKFPGIFFLLYNIVKESEWRQNNIFESYFTK